MRTLFLATLVGMAIGQTAIAEPFRFVALGDMPYGQPSDVYPAYEALIDEVNARAPDLVLHVGDTKSGSTPCSDEMLSDQLGFLNAFAAPVIYTPGDNEWTDCHRKKAGGFDPLDRLAFIRKTYFDDPAWSFGKTPVELISQASEGYPENTRMLHKEVMFVAAHVVGSNNNFEIRDLMAAQEFFARDAASTQWVADGFDAAMASDAQALVLAIHADMFEFDFNSFGKERWLRHSGFGRIGETLKTKSSEFGKPVLLIFGDSHVFRQFRPFPKSAPNIMALEVYGAKDMHAVEITADPERGGVFSIAPLINPAL